MKKHTSSCFLFSFVLGCGVGECVWVSLSWRCWVSFSFSQFAEPKPNGDKFVWRGVPFISSAPRRFSASVRKFLGRNMALHAPRRHLLDAASRRAGAKPSVSIAGYDTAKGESRTAPFKQYLSTLNQGTTLCLADQMTALHGSCPPH